MKIIAFFLIISSLFLSTKCKRPELSKEKKEIASVKFLFAACRDNDGVPNLNSHHIQSTFSKNPLPLLVGSKIDLNYSENIFWIIIIGKSNNIYSVDSEQNVMRLAKKPKAWELDILIR